MRLAGVDGCRAGWIAALGGHAGDPVEIRVFAGFAEIMAAVGPDGIIAVDMPIGLPETIAGPGRRAEQAVRPLLGGRQSSVFSVPSRSAVEAPDYPSACSCALATSDPPRKVSRQSFMLFPKVREIDILLRVDATARVRVFETHPEVAFRMMAGRPLAEPKKVKSRPHPAGLAERRGLLAAAGLGTLAAEVRCPPGAGPDDLLDALASLVVARRLARGEAVPYPNPPDRDAFGLPIAIWA